MVGVVLSLDFVIDSHLQLFSDALLILSDVKSRTESIYSNDIRLVSLFKIVVVTCKERNEQESN
jgi:hypothetical protein